MSITPEEIARLRALEAKATPGPWENCAGVPVEFTIPADCHLIVKMRNALPALLDEVDRLRAEVIRLQQHRTKLDCRYVGDYGDSDARHCLDSETPKPCQRCELEMENEGLRADLREAVDLLRHGGDWRFDPRWDLARRDALLAKHKETL